MAGQQNRKKEARGLERVLEVLDMGHVQIPSTKVNLILTEAFYLEILERLAAKVIALEILADRDAGFIDLLAGVAEQAQMGEEAIDRLTERAQTNEDSIDALAEGLTLLRNRVSRKAEADK